MLKVDDESENSMNMSAKKKRVSTESVITKDYFRRRSN